MSSSTRIPDVQHAVQLIGPSELRLNPKKEVHRPGPTQILARVEAVGLCFSDLKLLKQFTQHARKSEIVSGISQDVLREIPSYVPGVKPTVPGHEAVCRIVALGDEIQRHEVGERVLVQTDYRELKTEKANAAFGYNFEGALQEYVLMDERVVIDPTHDERFLLPASEALSASAIALVEPWACVEDSYVTQERQTIKPDGSLLIVVEGDREIIGLAESFPAEGPPKSVTLLGGDEGHETVLTEIGLSPEHATAIEDLPEKAFDDIVYLGVSAEAIEALGDKLANQGIFNLVMGGKTSGRPVSIDVGRVHYGMTRWCGTKGTNSSHGYAHIPKTGEIRRGENLLIIGAGGPMGQMHVVRDLSIGAENLTLVATDFDSGRLTSLGAKANPLAERNGANLRLVNPQKTVLNEKFSYIALMAPVAQEFSQLLAAVTFAPPTCTFIDNVTGKEERDPENIRAKLIDQLTSPVLWTDAVDTAWSVGGRIFIECGPKAVLQGLVKRIIREAELRSSEKLLGIAALEADA